MKKQPLVSIIIPVYNGANYMREAIDSALNQTYSNVEVLVINDGSNDNGETEKIALTYGDKIRYFHKKNGGVSTALNLGIQNMRGDYFSWLSHDDVYFAEKVEKQVETLVEFGDDMAVCYCNSIQINKNSERIGHIVSVTDLENKKAYDWHYVLRYLLKEGTFNGCALLVSRRIFVDYELWFDETMRFSQDALMWYLIFAKVKPALVYADFLGVKGRVHDKQLTQTGKAYYLKDSEKIARILKPLLLEGNQGKDDLVYLYMMSSAKYRASWSLRYFYGDKECRSKVTLFGKIKLHFMRAYGCIRPAIRRVYYKAFKKVKTK